jgi:hypothetical protein
MGLADRRCPIRVRPVDPCFCGRQTCGPPAATAAPPWRACVAFVEAAHTAQFVVRKPPSLSSVSQSRLLERTCPWPRIRRRVQIYTFSSRGFRHTPQCRQCGYQTPKVSFRNPSTAPESSNRQRPSAHAAFSPQRCNHRESALNIVLICILRSEIGVAFCSGGTSSQTTSHPLCPSRPLKKKASLVAKSTPASAMGIRATRG